MLNRASPLVFASAALFVQALAAPGITGPLLEAAHADPCVIKLDNGSYFSFATNHKSINVPVTMSPNDLQSGWKELDGVDALKNPGKWVKAGDKSQVGSPDVNILPDGSFIMYYSAVPIDQGKDHGKAKHCIGAAFSKTILGPYQPQDNHIICGDGPSGTGFIAPNYFSHAGSHYLLYKNGSAFDPQHESRIYIQEFEADGFTKKGDHKELFHSDKKMHNDTEGPALVVNPSPKGSGFVLFYDAGFFRERNYRIEYAVSKNLMGPYTYHGTLLSSFQTYEGINVTAPGGPDFVSPENPVEMTFMAWKEPDKLTTRLLHAAKLQYNGDDVSLVGM